MVQPKDTWDAKQYERYKDRRREPFDDLLALVRKGGIRRAVDLGCGTGELTAELHAKLGAHSTLGLDSSANMLARARQYTADGLRFEQGDIAEFTADGEYDLVFSNAALHWLPDHPALLERLWRALAPGGQLAVQLPANAPHATQLAAVEVAEGGPFAEALRQHNIAQGRAEDAPVAGGALAPERYAEILHGLGAAEQHVRLQVYSHELPDEQGAFEWIRGSLLTGYEAALGAELYPAFEAAYRERLFELIPPQSPYLLTYRRILFWARKINQQETA